MATLNNLIEAVTNEDSWIRKKDGVRQEDIHAEKLSLSPAWHQSFLDVSAKMEVESPGRAPKTTSPCLGAKINPVGEFKVSKPVKRRKTVVGKRRTKPPGLSFVDSRTDDMVSEEIIAQGHVELDNNKGMSLNQVTFQDARDWAQTERGKATLKWMKDLPPPDPGFQKRCDEMFKQLLPGTESFKVE